MVAILFSHSLSFDENSSISNSHYLRPRHSFLSPVTEFLGIEMHGTLRIESEPLCVYTYVHRNETDGMGLRPHPSPS